MNVRRLAVLVLTTLLCATPVRAAEKLLRVFIHAAGGTADSATAEAARFLEDWRSLLQQRGASVRGASAFPTRRELAATDVLILFSAGAAPLHPREEKDLERFLRRGGGVVVLRDAVQAVAAEWFSSYVGGRWDAARSRSTNALFGLYFGDYAHPLAAGLSNFDLDDQFAHGLTLVPGVRPVASTFHTAKEIVPQIWTFETNRTRAFVALPGRQTATFALPHYRGLLLRGIAWAGRQPLDTLTRTDETAHFRYPAGGPTAPEEAVKKIRVLPEFEISLVAAEPLIVNPISIDWDPRGRMWVAVTPEYPFHTDAAAPRDAILVLEDRDGDGRMDRRHVFHEGLNLVTSFVFYRDGVVVAQAPDILWLRDTNGDGVADRREVLFTGFGTYDTHAVISNFRWSMDGWIYATQGYSGRDSTNVVNGAGRSFGKIPNGILRFKPDGSALESVSSFNGNTWGLDFNWENELFFSKANGPHLSHLVMPEKFLGRGLLGKATSDKTIEDHQKVVPLFTDRRHEYVQVAPVGVFTAAAGAMIYDGGAWPEKYHGSFYVCEPTVHIVHEDVILTTESPTYEATKRQEEEFIAATDLWFRPVHCRVGPDGAMYILDFYNQAVSHNDIRGIDHGPGNAAVRPDRDHLHGRIWRVQHKLARKHDVPVLEHATPAQLGEALEHPNGWVRQTAQRLLLERGDHSATPVLTTLVTNRLPQTRIQALWALHQIEALRETNLLTALKDPHPSVLKNALMVMADQRFEPSAALEKAIVAEGKDGGERARLLSLLALAQWQPGPDAFKSAIRLFPDLKDDWSKSAVLGLARMDIYEALKTAFGDKADSYRDLVPALIERLARRQDNDLAARLIVHLADRKPETDKLKVSVLENLGRKLSDEFSPTWSPDLEKAIKKLLNSEGRAVRVATFPLANRYATRAGLSAEIEKVKNRMVEELGDEKLKEDQRTALITSILTVKDVRPDVIDALGHLLATTKSDGLKKHIVKELGGLKESAAATVLVQAFANLNEETREIAFGNLMKRDAWALLAVESLEAGRLKLSAIGPQGAGRLRSHADPAVARRAAAVLDKLQGPLVREKDALIARLRPALDGPADAKNGKAQFKQNCAVCHKFNGEGKDIGPDLTGMGLHGPLVLLTHILDPNRTVEPNYIPYNVTTKKDEEFFGLIARETKETLVLKNLEGELELKKADIANSVATGLSMMPEGFESLGEVNLRDIIHHLLASAPRGYRTLDLTGAYTADSRRNLFTDDADRPSLDFKRFGLVMVDNVPFSIASPSATPDGRNVVVLRGGTGLVQTLPQRVEIKAGVRAEKLHILGGVGGWAYPDGKPEGYGVAVARAVLCYADGQTEEIVFHNGREFADYSRQAEVPGSSLAPGLVTKGQLRWFTLNPKRNVTIDRIVIESLNTHVAPAFVAMTAQIAQ